MSKKKDSPKTSPVPNPFMLAVNATPDVMHKGKSGLSALGSDSGKVSPDDPRKVDGSLDIDESVKALYPEASRWDYAVSYDGKVHFIEVHPAATSEVNTVLKKLDWLKAWLRNQAPAIDGIKAENPYHWVYTSGYGISKGSPQYRRLAQVKLLPKAECILS